MSKYADLDELLITSGNSSIPLEERQEAFALFYSKTEGFVRSRMVKKISDYHQREDLLQDTYERLWSKAHQYRPQKNLFPYLERVIQNIIINHGKRHGRRWNMQNLESILEWENRLDENGNFYEDNVV